MCICWITWPSGWSGMLCWKELAGDIWLSLLLHHNPKKFISTLLFHEQKYIFRTEWSLRYISLLLFCSIFTAEMQSISHDVQLYIYKGYCSFVPAEKGRHLYLYSFSICLFYFLYVYPGQNPCMYYHPFNAQLLYCVEWDTCWQWYGGLPVN